jgi:hypothetical protein
LRLLYFWLSEPGMISAVDAHRAVVHGPEKSLAGGKNPPCGIPARPQKA